MNIKNIKLIIDIKKNDTLTDTELTNLLLNALENNLEKDKNNRYLIHTYGICEPQEKTTVTGNKEKQEKALLSRVDQLTMFYYKTILSNFINDFMSYNNKNCIAAEIANKTTSKHHFFNTLLSYVEKMTKKLNSYSNPRNYSRTVIDNDVGLTYDKLIQRSLDVFEKKTSIITMPVNTNIHIIPINKVLPSFFEKTDLSFDTIICVGNVKDSLLKAIRANLSTKTKRVRNNGVNPAITKSTRIIKQSTFVPINTVK